jgi:hypothetical protein
MLNKAKPALPPLLALLPVSAFAMHAEPSVQHKMDIPDGFSAVLCPSEASALRMMNDFHVGKANGHVDTDRFLEGLRMTGCEQSGGPIVIEAFTATRKIAEIPEADYAVYRGRDSSGRQVFGVTDRYLNDRYPRNPWERWLYIHSDERSGYIDMSKSENPGYVCPTPEAAQKVIAAIPPLKVRGGANPDQVKAKNAALKANRCSSAKARYQILAKHGEVFISLGYEAGEEWTALTAKHPVGKIVGLLYDSSQL